MRSSLPVVRVLVVAASMSVLSMLSGAVAKAPAAASVGAVQESDQGDIAPDGSADADEEFDGRSTQDTVRLVVGTLVGIAAATTVMMLVFVWHTSPRRRLRVATGRAEREQERARAEADDEGEGVTLDELLGERDETEADDWDDAEDAGVELGDLAAESPDLGEDEEAESDPAEGAEVGEHRD